VVTIAGPTNAKAGDVVQLTVTLYDQYDGPLAAAGLFRLAVLCAFGQP